MIGLDDRDERAQSLHFGAEDTFAERKESVIDAPLIAVRGECARLRLVDESFALQAADVAIGLPASSAIRPPVWSMMSWRMP